MSLILIALGWCIGIAVSAALTAMPMHPNAPWFWIMACGAAIIALGLAGGHTALRGLCLVLIAFTLGGLRTALMPPAPTVTAYNDRGGYTLEGVLSAPPDTRETYTLLTLDTESITYNGEPHAVQGRVLVRVEGSSPAQSLPVYGDRVRATGLLTTPPLGDSFSYRDYLARSSIYSLMIESAIEVVGHESASPISRFYQALYAFRDRMSAAIDSVLPQPTAGVLRAMLIGDARSLTPETADAFSITGASHLLVVSGFNLTLLGSVVSRTLRSLGLRAGWAAAIGLVAIAIYALLVGASGGVLRAALVSALLLIGEALRRRTFLPTSLGFAALMITLLNPAALWDVGFQLSFTAALGLALFSTPIEAAFTRALAAPRFRSPLTAILIENTSASLAAQFATLPLLALHFGQLSLVGLPANLLIVPLQPLILLTGITGGLLSLIVLPLGAALLWLAALPLAFTLVIVESFARLPSAQIGVGAAPAAVIIFYLMITCGGLLMVARPDIWKRLRIPLRLFMLGAGFSGSVVLALLLATLAARPDGRLHVWFLGMGAGENAVVARTPGGAYMLIDGGAHPNRLVSMLDSHMPPLERELALVALTQPNPASYRALDAVLSRYTVQTLIGSGQPNSAPDYNNLIARAGSRWHETQGGERFTFSDGTALTVLYPDQRPSLEQSPRNNALVLRLEYGEVSFLLSSGLGEGGQERLLAADLSPVTVLHVPAALNRDVDTALYARLQPQVSILPVLSQRDTALGEEATMPAQGVAARIAEGGLVHVMTDGQRLWFETETPPSPLG